MLLMGCAPTGDFGRREASIFHDEVVPRIGDEVAHLRGEPVSKLPMTDHEKHLRVRAHGLVRPLRADMFVDDVKAQTQFARLDPAFVDPARLPAYYLALRKARFASSEARFAALDGAIRADIERLPPFAATARRVHLADEARLRALEFSPLGPGDRAEIADRVAENRHLVAWVGAVLRARADAFAYALERLAVETPSTRVPAVQASLEGLEAVLARPGGVRDPETERSLDRPVEGRRSPSLDAPASKIR